MRLHEQAREVGRIRWRVRDRRRYASKTKCTAESKNGGWPLSRATARATVLNLTSIVEAVQAALSKAAPCREDRLEDHAACVTFSDSPIWRYAFDMTLRARVKNGRLVLD